MTSLTQRIAWRLNDCRDLLRERLLSSGKGESVDHLFDASNSGCRWRRTCLAHDPETGWRFLRNHVARILRPGGYYTLRTNAMGIRSDRDYPHQIGGGRRRVIVLGDSFTAGDGVDNGQRFTDILEKQYPHLDVINFGLPGSGTDQQVLTGELRAKPFATDAYVFCVYVENIFRNRMGYWPALEWSSGRLQYRAKPYFRLENGELVACNVPVPVELRTDETLGDWRSTSSGYLTDGLTYDDAYAGPESEWWRLLAALLERFCRGVSDVPVFIVPLPASVFIEGSTPPVYRDLFATLHAPGRGRHVLDILPRFLAEAPSVRRRCTLPRDHHYTPLGHERVAEALAAGLREHAPHLLSPPGSGGGTQ